MKCRNEFVFTIESIRFCYVNCSVAQKLAWLKLSAGGGRHSQIFESRKEKIAILNTVT